MRLDPPPVRTRLSGTTSHVLHSSLLNEPLRIDVSVPLDYDTGTASYPVVYLLDGNWLFPVVSHLVRPMELNAELPPLIVVGIGYHLASDLQREEFERIDDLRFRDLTPTAGAGQWWTAVRGGKALRPGVEPGNASRFLQAIENDVKPLIRAQYRVDPAQQTLAGYSLGGLCVLHALFEQPMWFDSYLAASPALWWDDGVMLKKAAAFAETQRWCGRTVFVSIGAREEDAELASFQMVSNLRWLADQLQKQCPSLRLKSLVLDGETHASAIAPSLLKGLQWSYAANR